MPLITTRNGLTPTEALRRVDGVYEDENERTVFIEYYDDHLPDPEDRAAHVHRSAHVQLKRLPDGMEAVMGALGG